MQKFNFHTKKQLQLITNILRPKLDKTIDPEVFLNYYWLKSELFSFCKNQSIPSTGSKKEITDRIVTFLKTGKIPAIKKEIIEKSKSAKTTLSLDSKIPNGYKNDENHRAFFKSVIGDHFKFNVPFMNWMKENSGKTYQEAADKWKQIIEEKKSGKKFKISSQFEYNQYTRDFFKANPGLSRSDAIKCWKYKKSLPGTNKYENKDLEIIN